MRVMAAPVFPPTLQRTSDEQWLSLHVVTREDGRLVARIDGYPRQAAVVRTDGGADYAARLRHLLVTPPPYAGRGIHVAWPVDLLHDLDGEVVGYTARRSPSRHTVPLAEFADPQHIRWRKQAGPRRTVRVARNVAAAVAALHHAGHSNISSRQFRVDDDRVVVVRVDDLLTQAHPSQKLHDERRLAGLIVRLLPPDGVAEESALQRLLIRDDSTPRARDWYFALRDYGCGPPRM